VSAVASAGHVQVCTALQTDNHASTSPLSFLQVGCPSCRPTNSIKALKAILNNKTLHDKTLLVVFICTLQESLFAKMPIKKGKGMEYSSVQLGLLLRELMSCRITQYDWHTSLTSQDGYNAV